MPKYGDPFFIAVMEGNLDGEITSADVMTTGIDHESAIVAGLRDDCAEHGGAVQLYVCVPIGRVWATNDEGDDEGERRPYDVAADIAETQLERMARAAPAMGGR